MLAALLFLAGPPVALDPLPPGTHARRLVVDGRERTYLLHVPKALDRTRRAPLVLALHGAGMTGAMMMGFCGLNAKAQAEGFVVAYPDGRGLVWNAGGLKGEFARRKPDDVRFLSRLIDEVSGLVRIDESRVYATGMSNGGMMCYRLGDELSHRLAAVAPVAGTMAIPRAAPKRALPLLHLHCRGDRIVPYDRPERSPLTRVASFRSAPASAEAWAVATGCEKEAKTSILSPQDGSRTRIVRQEWAGGKGGVVLISIDGGGHLWPGRPFPLGLIAPVNALSANDSIWEFFKKHRLP
ncbi:MAG: hypothetical protein K2W96_11250 [Gemmataceae bacterium]|nr:hypothetical protein [Gemmataceae bacterium]